MIIIIFVWTKQNLGDQFSYFCCNKDRYAVKIINMQEDKNRYIIIIELQ